MNFIGIDLGTTYSAVATIDEFGRPVILKNSDGENLTPSAVYIGSDGTTTVGAEAKEMLQSGDMGVAVLFKRYMGQKDFTFMAGDREYSATDLSAILLKKLKDDASKALGAEVTDAVITVPAYFNDLQRTETMKAGEMAGLHVMRIINEPTAAAITYGISRSHNQKMLVYDLGGGTFDVTVLDITPDAISVMATGGDHELGGKDWDDQIMAWAAEQFRLEFGLSVYDSAEALQDLTYECERVKKQLTQRESAPIVIRYEGQRGKYEMTRHHFEELTSHLMENTKAKTAEVLEEAGLTWSDLAGVLLVGGSTRMPMVENWVRQMSGKEPLRGVNVDEAVCMGAAIQAGIEMERRGMRLSAPGKPQFTLGSRRIDDVMSHSLGAVALSQEGDRYVNSIIIRKNTKIPVAEQRPFKHKTRPGAKNELTVYLTQGETADLRLCLVVGKYIFSGIEATSSGETIINIAYAYDENGVIVVSGTQKETGRKLKVEKVPLDDDMNWLYEPPKKASVPLSIIIAIDLSGSMSGQPEAKAKEAAMSFARQIDISRNQMAVLGFADRPYWFTSFTNDPKKAKKAIEAIACSWGDMGTGNSNNPLETALNEFEKHGRNTKCILVVLTDGIWGNPKAAIKTSDLYRKKGYDIIAVGFGCADEKFLKRISTSSEAALLTNLDSLVGSFSSIAQEISSSGGVGGISWKK